jgi:uncharacterized membrane protein YdjX (TVP38/TMEM64 family)
MLSAVRAKPTWLKLLALAAAITALMVLGRRAGGWILALAEQVAGLGAWAPVAFVGVYVLGALALAPGSLMTLAAGAIFGLLEGTALVFLAATLGAAAAFVVARHLARDYVEQRIGGGRLAAVDQAIARNGLRLVLLLRLSPVLPYNLLNYSLGLTRVRFRDFLLGSVGMLPGTILYVYYGKVVGDVATLAKGSPARHDPAYWVLLGVGLAATIAASVMVTRAARRSLQAETGVAGPPGTTEEAAGARRRRRDRA